MFDFFDQLYKSSNFMPHGDCFVWNTSLLWQHVGSDIATGVAYYLIAAVLFYLIFKRRDIPFHWVFLLFGAFFLSCGTTHFMAAWTIYYPSYWAQGIVKTVNAGISLGSAIVLIPLMPRLLALPSLQNALDEVAQLNKDLSQKVISLEEEVRKRETAENELRMAKFSIDRTAMLIFWIKEDSNFVYVNDHACEILGSSYEELLSKRITEIAPSLSQDKWRDHWENLKEQGSSTFRTELQKKDGTDFPVEVTENYLEYKGIGYNFSYATDITNRLKAEEEKKGLESQLQQSQKMEAIGTLAGGIAHDFNNILAAVMGNTEIAMMHVDSPDSLQKDLSGVLKGANRAKELIRQILTFSRKSDQQLQPLRVQLIVKEVLKLLRSSIPTTIEIKQNINPDCPAVLANPTQIHQVLMNLCTNAYQAMMESGGVLGVSLQPVELSPEDMDKKINLQPGSYLKLEISDTGSGMTKDTLERIFEPYYTTKAKGAGTGLGLAVVHGIVNSFKGDISVSSESGEGTTFEIYMPIAATAKAAIQEDVIAPLLKGNERILLVDDDEEITHISKTLLESLGYKVTALTNSLETLQKFQEEPAGFDLVITDMTMPNITGIELTKRILAIRPDMPIILSTGFSNLINEEQAKALGIRGYIMKPVVKEDMAKTIRKALESS